MAYPNERTNELTKTPLTLVSDVTFRNAHERRPNFTPAEAQSTPPPPAPWPTIIVTGSRDRHDERTVCRTLDAVADTHGGLRVVVGDCPRGIDRHTRRWCWRNAYRCQWRVYQADWKHHGRAAGPIRNQRMVNAHRDALVCLAFPLPGPRELSKGTWGCVEFAEALGIRVQVIPLEAA